MRAYMCFSPIKKRETGRSKLDWWNEFRGAARLALAAARAFAAADADRDAQKRRVGERCS